jgi:CubicO group peptidase (beta-lactamase class C family)
MKDTLGDPAWPDDFWERSTPEAEGLDPEGLGAAVRVVEERGWPVHSLLVVRHGRLVLERYGTDAGRQLGPDDVHELHSTAKTVTAAVLGMAIAERRIAGVRIRVLDYFRDPEIGNRSPAKERMTLEDLLTMRSGLVYQEGSERLADPPSAALAFLSRPMAAEPGTRFNYSSADSQVIAEILRRATGIDPGAWARARIFEPLGIRNVRWDADASGTTFGGFGLWLRPRDLARFGWMLLSRGRWKGEAIVPEEWIATSTRPHVDTGEWPSGAYGYQCWAPRVGGFATRGYMGQFVYAFPDRDLMAVFTGGLPPPPQADAMIDGLLREFILPAVK